MESLLILHAAAAICAPWLTRRLGRDALLVLALAPAAGFVYTVWAVVAGLPRQSAHAGVPRSACRCPSARTGSRLMMMALVTGIGALVLVFSSR